MRSLALFATAFIVLASPAQADPRDVLRDCQALLARANQSGAGKPSESDISRCRQVVRDWTLRESRMPVDENGKPLR